MEHLCFNSRPHEEVDIYCTYAFIALAMFQLTTSRRGRRCDLLALMIAMNVSTHDLTKRSTMDRCIFSKTTSVSTHDLTKRSTHSPLIVIVPPFVFQLTTSRRGRRGVCDLCHRSLCVSTHDLTKRSTAIFTQKVFLSKSLFVLIAYNIFILH